MFLIKGRMTYFQVIRNPTFKNVKRNKIYSKQIKRNYRLGRDFNLFGDEELPFNQSYRFIKTRKEENIAFITIDDHVKFNFLHEEIVEELNDIYHEYSEDTKIEAVFLNGIGENAFCSGTDYERVFNLPKTRRIRYFRDLYQSTYYASQISNRSPHYAIMDGFVLGSGIGLAMACNIRIATENTIVATNEGMHDFFCENGASYFLPRLNKHFGYYMGLTNRPIKGHDLKKAGIATHIVKGEDLADLIYTLQLYESSNLDDINETIRLFESEEEPDKVGVYDKYGDFIDYVFKEDSIEKIKNELKSSKLKFSKDILKSMSKISTPSQQIIFSSFKKGSTMDLKSCLQMDFTLSYNILENYEAFKEGKCENVTEENEEINLKI